MKKKLFSKKIVLTVAVLTFLCSGVAIVFADGMPLQTENSNLPAQKKQNSSIVTSKAQKTGTKQTETEIVESAENDEFEFNALAMADDQISSEGIVNQALRDFSDNLRLFSFEDESFAVQDLGNKDKGKIAIFSDGNRFVRKFFDSKMRLFKTETWTLGDSPEIILEETFAYDDKSGNLVLAQTKKTDFLQEDFYDNKSNLSGTKKFKIKKDTLSNSEQKILETSESWKYLSDGKIGELSFEKMDSTGKKVAFFRREVFSYKKDAKDKQPPDTEIYEDGKLRERRVYSSAENYETTIFFDNDMKITEKYEGGVKVADAFWQKEQIVRSKNYEQN